MVNRRNTVYVTLPQYLSKSEKRKDAKASISIGIVVPKELEKKATKFIDKMNDDFTKEFKKFMKKQFEKYEE